MNMSLIIFLFFAIIVIIFLVANRKRFDPWVSKISEIAALSVFLSYTFICLILFKFLPYIHFYEPGANVSGNLY